MSKKFIFIGSLLILGIALLLTAPCFCEELTLTTIFEPSSALIPCNKQTEAIGVKKLVVGCDMCETEDLEEGELIVKSVIFKPYNGIPSESGKTGEMIYDASSDSFRYWNNEEWVSQFGGGEMDMTCIPFKCSWHCGSRNYRIKGPNVYSCISECEPPECPEDWIDRGIGCSPVAGDVSGETSTGDGNHSGYGYCERWCCKE